MDAGSQDGPNRWLRDALKRARAIARRGAPPRPAPRARLGLALAGGFARGIAHIGVLKVLAEHQVSVDCVAGTSVGANPWQITMSAWSASRGSVRRV